jgi:hypothetical protein
MSTQLQLIERSAEPWRLDDTTRAAGRRGVAQARAALRTARLRAAAGGDIAGDDAAGDDRPSHATAA